MNSESLCQVITDLIDEVNICMETQSSVDKMYDKLLKVLHNEMQDKLTPIAKGGKRKNTSYNVIGTMTFQICGKLPIKRS